MIVEVRSHNGHVLYVDPEVLMVTYGAHGLRVDNHGELEVLIITTEEAEWKQLSDADLVQPAGKPAKARKQ